MGDRAAFCRVLPAQLVLLLPFVVCCLGDRPTFRTWDDTEDAGCKPPAVATLHDAANSPAATSDTSGVFGDGSAAANARYDDDSGKKSSNVLPPYADSGHAGISDANTHNFDSSETDNGAVGDSATGETDSERDHGCSQAIANGIVLNGTSHELFLSLGAPIGELDLLYLSEVGLYAVAFERGLSTTGLALATIDELGHVISGPMYINSPLLDKSRFDSSPRLAWNGSTLGLLIRGDDSDENDYLFGLTLALNGAVLSERQWPADTVPDQGFELASLDSEFIGFWHLGKDSETLSVVQRFDAELQPLGSTWQPLAAEPWLPAVAVDGSRVALTRGTREEAQLHVLSDALEPVPIGRIDEPNSQTPLVVGTSSGYALAWNRSNQQIRFAKYGDSGGTPECGPVLLSDEPRNLAGFTAMRGGYLALTATDDYPKHVEWLAVSDECVVGPATSLTYESATLPAVAVGASTVVMAWVELEQNIYTLKYAVTSNTLCP